MRPKPPMSPEATNLAIYRIGQYALGLKKQEKPSCFVNQSRAADIKTNPNRERISINSRFIEQINPKAYPHPKGMTGLQPYTIVFKKFRQIIKCGDDTEAVAYAALIMTKTIGSRIRRNQVGLYRPDKTLLARMAIHQSATESSSRIWAVTTDRNLTEDKIPETISLAASKNTVDHFYSTR